MATTRIVGAQKDLFGTDWKFPLQPDGQGRLARVSGLENLRQAISNWIMVATGEMLYERDKGIGIRDEIHQSVGDVIRTLPPKIELGLMKWEKRLKSVTVTATRDSDPANRNLVYLSIRYLAIGYGVEDNLTVPVDLARAKS